MKKNVFLIIGVIAFAGVIAFNVSENLRSSSLSDIALANVEALARNEGGGSSLDCYQTVDFGGPDNPTHQTYCGDCSATLCRRWANASQCSAK